MSQLNDRIYPQLEVNQKITSYLTYQRQLEPHDVVVQIHENNKQDIDPQTKPNYNLINLVNMFIWLTIFVISIVELVMANKYASEITCTESIVPIHAWLEVKGWLGIGFAVFDVLMLILFCCCPCCALCWIVLEWMIAVLYPLFKIIWLIIGSISFWSFCIDCGPTQINSLMWCSLIIGYVTLIGNFLQIYLKMYVQKSESKNLIKIDENCTDRLPTKKLIYYFDAWCYDSSLYM